MLLSAYRDNLPVLSSLQFFNLQTKTMCDIYSLSLILRCMPYLRQLIFTLMSSHQISHCINDLLDGHQWQRMLTSHVPHLKTFDFLHGLFGTRPQLKMDGIVRSFQYFVEHYNGWHMAVERSQLLPHRPEEYVNLRSLTNPMNKRDWNPVESNIVLGTLGVRSTLTTDVQYHIFHDYNRELEIIVPINMRLTGNVPSCPPFQNVQHLIVTFEASTSTIWQNIWKPVSMSDENDKIDPKECVNTLRHLVDLSAITKLDFESKNSLSQLHCIEQILLVCPIMIQLKTDTQLFLSPILFDSPSFTAIFSRLQRLHLFTENVDGFELMAENIYFPLKYASKLIQRFPSLIEIKLHVFSCDICVHLVDILLDGLVHLHYVRIYFTEDTLLDNPYPRNYMIEKRRQAFPLNIFNEDKVVVKVDQRTLEIYL